MSSKSGNSSALFTTVAGEPMSFFIRPGPAKSKLQPLITSRGGVLCSVQSPSAVLLIDPEERASVHSNTANRYVTTTYIYDCIEREELLNIEDYRLNPLVATRQSARLKNKRGRTLYTPEEDAAILSYVSMHKGETGGNRLWQVMERHGVTSHSWQSMKHHYRVLTSAEKKETAEKDNKGTGNQETDGQKPPSEDAASAQTHSADTDLTQMDVRPDAADSAVPENTEAEMADASNLPQPVGACLDPQTDAVDAEPTAAESTEPETAEQQAATSPQKERVPQEPVQPLPNTPAPAEQAPPKRTCTRWNHEMSSDRKSNPSSTAAAKLPSPLQPMKKTKSPERPAVEQPPCKKPRGGNMAPVAESRREESDEAALPDTPQADEEPKSLSEKVEKKKEKRKLGILEMATREFEDESESADDEAPDLHEPSDAAGVQPASPEPISSAAAADPAPTASSPEPGPSFRPQAFGSGHATEAGCPEPAAAEAERAASRAHLFIFDSESQEEDSQTLVGDDAAALPRPQPPANKDAAFSLTQLQLEEDVRRVRNLMNQTNQDLESVTKALLITSGDFSAALDLLLDPSSIPRATWSRRDDALLLSADPIILLHLQEKYSEEEVAKRIMFLETER